MQHFPGLDGRPAPSFLLDLFFLPLMTMHAGKKRFMGHVDTTAPRRNVDFRREATLDFCTVLDIIKMSILKVFAVQEFIGCVPSAKQLHQ